MINDSNFNCLVLHWAWTRINKAVSLSIGSALVFNIHHWNDCSLHIGNIYHFTFFITLMLYLNIIANIYHCTKRQKLVPKTNWSRFGVTISNSSLPPNIAHLRNVNMPSIQKQLVCYFITTPSPGTSCRPCRVESKITEVEQKRKRFFHDNSRYRYTCARRKNSFEIDKIVC